MQLTSFGLRDKSAIKFMYNLANFVYFLLLRINNSGVVYFDVFPFICVKSHRFKHINLRMGYNYYCWSMSSYKRNPSCPIFTVTL